MNYRDGYYLVPLKFPVYCLITLLICSANIANGIDVKQWGLFEISLTSTSSYSNAAKYSNVSLFATFSSQVSG